MYTWYQWLAPRSTCNKYFLLISWNCMSKKCRRWQEKKNGDDSRMPAYERTLDGCSKYRWENQSSTPEQHSYTINYDDTFVYHPRIHTEQAKICEVVKYPQICTALYNYSSLKRSSMARVNEGSQFYLPPTYPQLEWTTLAFTLQLQSITELWLVLISRPAEGRRLSCHILPDNMEITSIQQTGFQWRLTDCNRAELCDMETGTKICYISEQWVEFVTHSYGALITSH